MNIGIVVDNPIRDLPGCILLASKIIKDEAKVFLIPMYQQKFDTTLLDLDIIILNYARLNNFKLIHKYKKNNIKVFILDTEGGVVSSEGADSIENWPLLLKKNGLAEWLDGYFFWGPLMHKSFETAGVMENQRLHLTGNPRFDFCHPMWSFLLESEKRGYILINTNFSAINPIYSTSREAEFQAFKSAGWDDEYIKLLLDESSRSFRDFLRTIEDLIVDNPTQAFVIRPHPFESTDLYYERFSRYNNCEISQNESVFIAISNAACIIHLNCGTAVESIQLHKVPLSLEFINTNFFSKHTPLPSKISLNVKSYKELTDKVKNLESLSNNFDFTDKYRNFVFPMFYHNDGNAAQRIADVLKEEATKPIKEPGILTPSKKVSFRGAMAYIEQCIYLLLGSKLGLEIRNTFQKHRRGKMFSKDKVEEQLTVFLQSPDDSRLKVSYAINPYTRQPLTSIKCELL